MKGAYHRVPVPLAVVTAGGMAAARYFPSLDSGAWWLLGVSLAVFLGIVIAHRRPMLSPLCVFFTLGYLLAYPSTRTDIPPDHILRFCSPTPIALSGSIETVAVLPGNRTRMTLRRVRLISRDGVEKPVRGGVSVVAYGDRPALGPGDRIRLMSSLKPFHNFTNPGGFDYRRYQAIRGVFVSAALNADRITLVDPAPQNAWGSGIRRYRQQVIRQINTAVSPEAASVLRALLVGDRSGISPELRAAFNRSGVGHLLAISGLHIGTVAASGFAILTILFKRIPWMLNRAVVYRAAALGALFPVVGYGLLAGASPSTQRAVIMVTLLMIALWVDRKGDLLTFIAAAALGIMVADPPAVFSLSFQLSFGAVISIALGLRRWRIHHPEKRKTIGRIAANTGQFVLVSFLAIAGTLPLVMGAFNEVSLIGPLVNCIAVPIVGFAILPLGLILTAIGAIAPGISIPGFAICGHGVDGLIGILEWASNLSFSAVLAPVPTPLETGLYYGLLGLVFFSKTLPRFRVMAVGWALLALSDAAYWGHERFWHRDLRITAIDVGQGSSSLIEFPGGRVMLVDGGGFSSNQLFDFGDRVLAPVLRRKKILTVNTVVLSHPNADHLNGLYWILDRFRVDRLWTNGERADTLSYKRFLRCVIDRGIPVETVHRQYPRAVIDTAEVRILHPPADAIAQEETPDGKTIDDHSIILKIQFKGVSVLLPGDIRESAERQLVADLDLNSLKSDILMVPHHGSRFSSSMAFIRRVAPRVAIISAGWRNRFGFPHADVLDRYHRAGSRLFRTDRDGAVGIRIEDSRVWVHSEGSNRFYMWRKGAVSKGPIDRPRLL